MASHAVPHAMEFAPAPGVARVRLVVRDFGTGDMGSLGIPYIPDVPAPVPQPTGATTPAPAHS
jgi:hypothetical protein